MPAQRIFSFPIALLIRDVTRLQGALADTKFGPPVAARLPAEFSSGFTAALVETKEGGPKQSGAAGTVGTLTKAQVRHFTDMKRLIGGARHTAGLAFPGQTTLLHAEFQVGVTGPEGLASELERAGKILAACQAHEGWIAADTTRLDTAITGVGGKDTEQEEEMDKKKGITAARNRAANTLYHLCLVRQNAANLEHPVSDLGVVAGTEEACARYLLDEFPPRSGSHDAEPPSSPSPPSPAA